MKTTKDTLPDKFTAEERYCYQWLYDCQVRGWLVDLVTKKVTWADNNDRLHTFNTLVSFAEFLGYRKDGKS